MTSNNENLQTAELAALEESEKVHTSPDRLDELSESTREQIIKHLETAEPQRGEE